VVHRGPNAPRTLEHDFSELFDAGLPVSAYDQDRRAEVKRFRAWLRENPFDVLHAHRDRALGFAYRATRGMARPALIANRGTTNPIPRWTWARRVFRSKRLGAAVAVAEAVKEALVEEGVAHERIEVIYGSVETDRFRPGIEGRSVRDEIGIDGATPLVGMPAALVHKKGHRDFLAMMPRVLAEEPDAHFLWVGEGRKERFAALAEGAEGKERLHWLGHRDDMPEIFAACSVVVCASTKGEGLTGTLREALAMARPVVTTDVSGNTEIVRDGETGRVVPVRDPEALARAVVATLREPDRAAAMAEKGRQWVLAHCTDAVRADQLEALYRRLAGG
jgi:glycosyltransferase involved in cell wall biosynthesis